MVFQGRSIQAKVELDLAPLELSITKANEMLQGLGGAFKFDTSNIESLAIYMGKVRDIFKMVSDEALKINQAFSNIQGIKSLVENLEIVKAKMESIHNDVDKINQAILKTGQSVTTIAQSEERLNGIMKSGLASAKSFNSQLITAQKSSQGLLSVHKGVTEYLVNEEQITRASLRTIQEQENLERLKTQQRKSKLHCIMIYLLCKKGLCLH